MTDHCINFTQHALDNGSDMALLYSKRQMTNHLHRIKSKRADIPNPEIPVRIHLALDKIPEVIKGNFFLLYFYWFLLVGLIFLWFFAIYKHSLKDFQLVSPLKSLVLIIFIILLFI